MDIIDISQLIFTAVAGIIGTAFSNELATRSHRYFNRGYSFKPSGVVRMFQSRGWVWYGFIFCSLMAIALSFVGQNRDSKEKGKLVAAAKTADSTLAAKMDSVNGAVIRSDTLRSLQMMSYTKQLDKWGLEIRDSLIVRKIVNPQAALNFENINPLLYRDSNGNYVYTITWENVGDGIMYNFQYKWWIFFHSDLSDVLKLHKKGTGTYVNKYQVVPPGYIMQTVLKFSDTANHIEFNKHGIELLCYELTYENAAGIRMPPFRNIFFLSTKHFEQNIPIVNREAHNYVDSCMRVLGYW